MRKRYPYHLEFLILLLGTIFFIPFYYMIVNTFKEKWDAIQQPWALPKEIILESYKIAFERMDYWQALFNTSVITLFSVVLMIVLSSLAAYGFHKHRNNWLYSILFVYFLIGLFVPPQTNIIPLYRLIDTFGLVDTIPGVILVNISGAGLAFDIFFYTIFLRTIPNELEEAATIDGANSLQVFWSVVFPLLKPATITIAIYNIMGAWNEFLIPFIFLQSSDKIVLTTALFTNFGQFSADWTVFMSMVVLSLIPVVIIFILLQRHIVDGIARGALKG